MDKSPRTDIVSEASWPIKTLLARLDAARQTSTVLTIAHASWLALGMYMLFSFVFQRLPSFVPHHGLVSIVIALCIVAFMARQREVVAVLVHRSAVRLKGCSTFRWIVGCLLAGSIMRLVVGFAFPSELFSDPAAYWELTERLIQEGTYAIAGTRSFWPPGFPFFLLVPVAMFGPEPWIPVVLNVLLYLGTSVVAFRLAERLAGDLTGRLAVLILAIWPNLVLTSAGPHKELLVMFLVTAAALSYLVASGESTARGMRWISTFGCGLCLGLSALTQPSTVFLGIVFLAYELIVTPKNFRRAFRRLVSIGFISAMTVLPWTARNYVVHEELIPINTAGGLNLYSANNPSATGGWIPEHLYLDQSLRVAEELHQSRGAYAQAVRWIDENRVQFVKLIVYKHSRYLCCDSFGAFWLWEHPRSTVAPNPVVGKAASWLSDGFWLLLWLAIIFGARNWKRNPPVQPALALLLSLPVYYSLVVHGIYQSEDKHHIWVAALLATVMAAALYPASQRTAAGATAPAGELDPAKMLVRE